MAELNQNLTYTITADDKSGPGTDSALANLLKQETAAKKANEQARKEGAETKKLFGAIAQALSGNFEGLAQMAAKAAAAMKGVKLSGLALGAVGLAVTGVVSVVKGLSEAFKRSSDEAKELKQLEFKGALDGIGEEAKSFADEMERANQAAATQRKHFEDEIQCIREMTKAENEFARQQALAMAKTADERDRINREFDNGNAGNDALLDEQARQREIKDATEEVARLEKSLAKAKASKANADKLGGSEMAELAAYQDRGGWGTFWDTLTDNLHFTDNAGDEAEAARNAEAAANAKAEAAKRVDDIQKKLEEARHRLEMANRKEEIAVVQAAADDQKDLNEEWQKADEAQAETAKQAQAEAEHAVTEQKKADEAEIQRIRLKDIADAKTAEQAASAESAAAQARLAAAQAQVQRAWGWYRDKSSMAAQLQEEKANADAERQYEKDFEKLKSWHPDWETAKNLTVDQEAVKRVALARREEDAAQKAVTEIDHKMDQVVAHLAKMTEEE